LKNDDLKLIDEAICGNPSAFGTLVLRYQDRLFSSLVYLTGSEEDARDVTQEAFVKAFVQLANFRRESAFYTWLYRIAFNTAHDRFRRKRPDVSLDAIQEGQGCEPLSDCPSPSDEASRIEENRLVRQAIDKLDEPFRSVLILRDLDGQSYDDIAEILDIPIGTLRSRLHRARARLCDQLRPLLKEELS
jgi:RNA polymerase sigma-70 factor, ECF subfamily